MNPGRLADTTLVVAMVVLYVALTKLYAKLLPNRYFGIDDLLCSLGIAQLVIQELPNRQLKLTVQQKPDYHPLR